MLQRTNLDHGTHGYPGGCGDITSSQLAPKTQLMFEKFQFPSKIAETLILKGWTLLKNLLLENFCNLSVSDKEWLNFLSVAIAVVVLSTLRNRTDLKEARTEWELCVQFCLPLKYMGKTNEVHRNHNLISAEEHKGGHWS